MNDVEVSLYFRHTYDPDRVGLEAVPNRDLAVAFKLEAVDAVNDPLVGLVWLNDKIGAPCCLSSCIDQKTYRRMYLGCDRVVR